ncbi:MAG TPA: hypothetical protein VLD38_05615 [Nitrosopumilaceae archaeon]|nr:hypothetical protein [Nitrosopumilaceae archaeon]
MTVKKGIEILDWWIYHKQKVMTQLKNDWHYESFDEGTCVSKMLYEAERMDIENLQLIRKQLVPNCNHPKEDLDLDPDTKMPYCMACNWDL